MQRQTRKLALMLVIGMLFGASVMLIARTRPENIAPVGQNGEVTGEESPLLSTPHIGAVPGLPGLPEIPKNTRVGLSVADQSAGLTATVSGLSLSEKMWVAIYGDKEGHPGWILGAARAHPGDNTISVELLRPLASGGQYYAALLGDDGDDEFNRLTDLPPFAPNKVVIVSFVAQ